MSPSEYPILITGAGGQYGGLVIQGLLAAGVPPASLILLTRSPARLADYAARGLVVRKGSFDDPLPQLTAAFAGAITMLLISTSLAGNRLHQHQAAVDAAVAAGVRQIVYTSIVGADLEAPTALVSQEHRATEKMLRDSGLYWTALRDAQYAQALTDVLPPKLLEAGVLQTNAGEGRMAFVSRDDCARAAVAVLAAPAGHRNRAYDITGPALLTWGEAVRIMGETVGKAVRVELVSDQEQLEVFDAMGIPREPVEGLVVDGNPWHSTDMVSFTKATRLGEMSRLSNAVEELTGIKAASFAEVCKVRLGKHQSVGKESV